ncbi:hypothetical protein HKBW3S42_01962, partial [Candidatus Hakubella thermalkaliphila]
SEKEAELVIHLDGDCTHVGFYHRSENGRVKGCMTDQKMISLQREFGSSGIRDILRVL